MIPLQFYCRDCLQIIWGTFFSVVIAVTIIILRALILTADSVGGSVNIGLPIVQNADMQANENFSMPEIPAYCLVDCLPGSDSDQFFRDLK